MDSRKKRTAALANPDPGSSDERLMNTDFHSESGDLLILAAKVDSDPASPVEKFTLVL